MPPMSINSGAGRAIRRVLRRRGIDLVRFPHWNEFAYRRNQLLHTYKVDVVLDVGANIGQYASELREHGFGGHIVSFEPLGNAFAQLAKAATSDGNWSVEQVALLNRNDDSLPMNVSENLVSSSTRAMLPRHLEAAPTSATTSTEHVKARTLDAVFRSHVEQGRSAYLKIDVQGAERDVLSGAGQSLDDIVGIELEIPLVHLYENDMLLPETLSVLDGLGFSPAWINPGLIEYSSGRLLQCDGIFIRNETD